MTEFWTEMEKGVKCIRLVEELLREEEKLMHLSKERGRPTNASEYKIARMMYALGELHVKPSVRNYFPSNTLSDED